MKVDPDRFRSVACRLRTTGVDLNFMIWGELIFIIFVNLHCSCRKEFNRLGIPPRMGYNKSGLAGYQQSNDI